MKKYIIITIFIAISYIFFEYMYFYDGSLYIPKSGAVEYFGITKGKEMFIRNKNGEFEKFEIKGVNLGLGIPGKFATERGITKEMYDRWFDDIRELGANTIRVYTLQGEDFYEAFYEYNMSHKDNPLYLIHGVWIDEELHMAPIEAHDPKFKNTVIESSKNVVDTIHGRYKTRNLEASGKQQYKYNISQWVYGYILGVEWEPDMVTYTNNLNKYTDQYNGKYMYTTNATRFETFLAELGDEVISYETEKYGQQRMIAFSNWASTDPFEYNKYNGRINFDHAQMNTDNIKIKPSFKSGYFASYHIYPYYPEFGDDGLGTKNLYKEYISKINNHHKNPVVISEFGVPSSRGIAAIEANRSIARDQGNMSEEEQGEAIVEMYEDIKAVGCSGAIVFVWQDEWFKRTWNTMSTIDLKNTTFWSDYQTNEQYFGLLSFDPGNKKSVCYVDGDKSEWGKKDVVMESNKYSVFMKYDEKYIYYMVDLKNKSPEKEELFIPIDTTYKTGSKYISNFDIYTDRFSDFIIRIKGKDNSEVFVQDRYDTLEGIYGEYIKRRYSEFNTRYSKNSSDFKDIRIIISEEDYYYNNKKITLKEYLTENNSKDKDKYSLLKTFNTGKLVYGNGNPESKDFNSLSDFCFGKDCIEIRIPWQLLNFYNPSKMEIHDDYYECYGVEPISIDSMYVGVGNRGDTIKMEEFPLEGWGKKVTYHERLKESYYILKDYWSKN